MQRIRLFLRTSVAITTKKGSKHLLISKKHNSFAYIKATRDTNITQHYDITSRTAVRFAG